MNCPSRERGAKTIRIVEQPLECIEVVERRNRVSRRHRNERRVKMQKASDGCVGQGFGISPTEGRNHDVLGGSVFYDVNQQRLVNVEGKTPVMCLTLPRTP